MTNDKIIYSIFDYSKVWSDPYRSAGYKVITIDIKNGQDIRLLEIPKESIYGILAAPECTHFSLSGAQYWKQKDNDNRTLQALELIGAVSRFILACNPVFWVIENPVGRLNRWLGIPKMYFQPYDYGDPYTKKTALWGRFNFPKKNPIKPIQAKEGHHSMDIYLGIKGRFGRRGELRSITPPGFAKAFFESNR